MKNSTQLLRAFHAAVSTVAWCAFFVSPSAQAESGAESTAPAPAAQANDEILVPNGFRTTLFASEPDVQQPIGIATDERGRLWVAENYTYADQATNFDLTKRDRVVILEDTDGDGRADSRKVFWDQAQKLTSVEVGYGGVWVLCAPQLLFIPDRNHDDVPDGPPEVVLDGWDAAAVRHNIVNGLRWGPDGWLYGRHGILATSRVGAPGAKDEDRTPINVGVWRYHPTRKVFEAVAHGTTNPWGFDFDRHGEMFFINTVIGHLWHLVPGAHYERMYGADFNPHLYGLIGQTADHFHWDTGEHWNDIRQGVSNTTSEAGGGHAHSGLMIYQGDNWPESYRNQMYTLNFHGRRLNADRLERRGSGYVGLHGEDMFFVQDEWFRGIDLIAGADGAVYIADWSDTGECHEADGVHHASGRIYRLAYGEPKWPGKFDLRDRSDAELVELQLHANDWYVRKARRLLAERHAAGQDMVAAREALPKLYDSQRNEVHRLRAMWCLAAIGAADEAWLREQLGESNEHLRVWAIRLLADQATVEAATLARFAELAAGDSSGLVRLYLAAALQRLPHADRWPIGAALAARLEDADDRQLPLMIWYGLEPTLPAAAEQAIALSQQPCLPLVRRHIARRLTSELEANGQAVTDLAEVAATSNDKSLQLDILRGMGDALQGRRRAPAPAGWNALSARLFAASDTDVRDEARRLGVIFGDPQAIAELRKVAADPQANAAERNNALRVLTADGGPETLTLLETLLDDPAVANEAVRGLAVYDDAAIPELVLQRYAALDAAGKELAIDTLTSRANYAAALLAAVKAGAIDRTALSASHARLIAGFNDAELTQALEETWGSIRTTADDKRALIDRLRIALTPRKLEQADASAGRVLFNKTCSNCHVLYGEGKLVGPDLTGSDRRNVTYLLENIVDPSATVGTEFRTTAVLLSSGRALSGVIVGETDKTLILRTQTEEIAVDRDDIEEMVPQELSLMPDGLLTQLTDEQIADLFAYLSTTAQVPLAE
ncbi:PVC-type heme-binding CxxCH protein [Lacipirellula parvula]|nr:PVC-type heme-binding CxxCH protein [Lacipirellula parvula]